MEASRRPFLAAFGNLRGYRVIFLYGRIRRGDSRSSRARAADLRSRPEAPEGAAAREFHRGRFAALWATHRSADGWCISETSSVMVSMGNFF